MALTLRDKERALYRAQAVLRVCAGLLEDGGAITAEDLARLQVLGKDQSSIADGFRELADRVDEIHSEFWFRREQQKG